MNDSLSIKKSEDLHIECQNDSIRLRAGKTGGQGGTKYRGPSCFEGPVEGPRSYKIFL